VNLIVDLIAAPEQLSFKEAAISAFAAQSERRPGVENGREGRNN
jgi:hypothetical protein